MPLGGLLKSEVREIAHKHDLRTADKAESREICFVADDNYRRFLKEYSEKNTFKFHPGNIVHSDGEVLGQHDGTEMFTIGQRKGLGVSHPTPLYVQKIEPATGQVVVGDNDKLFVDKLTAIDINWIAHDPSVSVPRECEVKIRYLAKPAAATITPLTDNSVDVIFAEKQRAITPGQSVVFYDGDVVLGGGLIE
jgi:tRNA-specific 2-thiouridylase